MGFGQKLKTILADRNLTLKELSRLSGVSINTLYSITKRDSATIDPQNAAKIAAALDIPVSALTGGSSPLRYAPVDILSAQLDRDALETAVISTMKELSAEQIEVLLASAQMMAAQNERKL